MLSKDDILRITKLIRDEKYDIEGHYQQSDLDERIARMEGQAETDELMLDHEERLILLEVGE